MSNSPRKSPVRQWKFPPALGESLLYAGFLATAAAIVIGSIRGLLYGALPLYILGWAAFTIHWWGSNLDRRALRRFLLVWGLFGGFLATSDFLLSDDIYRYTWEAQVVLSGNNPYFSPPDSAELEKIREKYQDVYEPLNNKDLPAIYPPLPQYLFAFIGIFSSDFRLIKVFWLILIAGAILPLLIGWLRAAELPTGRALVFLAHPLLLIEVLLSGHLDILLALAAIVLFWGVRVGSLAGVAAGMVLAVQAKLAPIVLIPHVLRALAGWRRRGILLAVFLLASAALYIPFSGGGVPVGSLGVYNRVWESNGSVYTLIRDGLFALDPYGTRAEHLLQRTLGDGLTDRLLEAPPFERQNANLIVARALAALLFGVVYTGMLLRRDPIELQWLAVVGAGILCAPVVHPWYLLAILPACLRGGVLGWIGMWWSLAILSTYTVLPDWWERGEWIESRMAWHLQYTGMLVLAVILTIYRQKSPRTETSEPPRALPTSPQTNPAHDPIEG